MRIATARSAIAPALALAAQLLGQSARAQDPAPPHLADPPKPAAPAAQKPTRKLTTTTRREDAPPRTDPLALEAAAILVGGGALGVLGIVFLATATEPETCGLTGCFERPDNGRRQLGSALVAGGAGAILIGGPALLAGIVIPAPTDAERRDEPMMLSGAALTASGNAVVGLGVGLLIANPHDEAKAVAAGLFALGGVLIATGVPLWARGASRVTRAGRPETASAAQRPPEVLIGAGAAGLRWRF